VAWKKRTWTQICKRASPSSPKSNRRCKECGRKISAKKRIDARFCSPKCGDRASYRRNKNPRLPRLRTIIKKRPSQPRRNRRTRSRSNAPLSRPQKSPRRKNNFYNCYYYSHKKRGIEITEEEYYQASDIPFCIICGRAWNNLEWMARLGEHGSRAVFEQHYRGFCHNFCNKAKGKLTIEEFQDWGKDVFGNGLEVEIARIKALEKAKDAMCAHLITDLEKAEAELVRLRAENEKLYYHATSAA
jgi:hypothetical protein